MIDLDEVVDEVIGALRRFRRGEYAKEEIEELRIFMLDGSWLAPLYDDHEAGVRRRRHMRFMISSLEGLCFLTGVFLVMPFDIFGNPVIDVDPEPLCETLIALWEGLCE